MRKKTDFEILIHNFVFDIPEFEKVILKRLFDGGYKSRKVIQIAREGADEKYVQNFRC
jgi:hypothetical protein